MTKSKNKTPIISFIGANATQVTGSIIMITTAKGTQIMLECGGVQGDTMEEDYRTNGNALNSVDVENVKYLFINHNHYDHIGLTPRLVKLGMQGRIITTHQTAKLMHPLLKDSAFISKKNAEYMTDKYKKPFPELYTEQDVESVFDITYEYGFDEIHKLDEEVSFKFLRNSHVLGASSLELFIKDSDTNKTFKIFYSSDLGNVVMSDRPYLSETEYCRKANVAIFESTYGDKDTHLTKKDRRKEIELIKKEVVDCCVKNRHTTIIPCFSFSRSQELMTILYQLFKDDENFKDIEVIVDSRLTKEIIKVYQEVLEGEDKVLFEDVLAWKNIKIISDFKKETSLVLTSNKPKVIISSSGMLEAGHSVEYIKYYIENPLNTILFVGYAGERTLAGRLRKDTETIVIEKGKKPYKKNARIITLLTFSSHMQKKELVDYICSINCEKVVLVHGEKEAKESLKATCLEELSRRDKTTNSIIVGQRNLKISL